MAFRKAAALLRCGAKVTVVSPQVTAGLKRLIGKRKMVWKRHPFRAGDLKGMQMVVAATGDSAVNRRAASEARRRGVWINVVDRPALCSFILPSVVRRGRLVLAISTGGASPALARWIRKDLGARYGPGFDRLLKRAAAARGRVLRDVRAAAARKRLFEKALQAYLRVLE